MSRPALKRTKSVAIREWKELATKVEKVDFSEHWFKKMRNIFRLHDLDNKTGYVTRQGLTELGEKIMATTGMSAEDAKETKAVLDDWAKDSIAEPDGKISFDEFCKLRYVMLTNPDITEDFREFTKELASVWFKVIDTNHNGVISKEEWRVFFKCINHNDPKIADTAFEAVDINGDGVLSKEEFVTGFFDFVSNQEKGRYDLFFGPLPTN